MRTPQGEGGCYCSCVKYHGDEAVVSLLDGKDNIIYIHRLMDVFNQVLSAFNTDGLTRGGQTW